MQDGVASLIRLQPVAAGRYVGTTAITAAGDLRIDATGSHRLAPIVDGLAIGLLALVRLAGIALPRLRSGGRRRPTGQPTNEAPARVLERRP